MSTTKAPFVSSLGNTLGASSSSSNQAGSGAAATTLVSAPSASSIHWPQSGAPVRNPFGVALGSNGRTQQSAKTSSSNNSNIMSAFSGLGLALDADGGVVSTTQSSTLSAAQQLIAAKSAERAAEARVDAERAAARNARKKQQEVARTAPRPLDALSQALGAFDAEIAQSDMLTRATSGSSSSSSATLSRRARQKKDRARERAEGYDSKRVTKSSRDVKRSQRKEKYKHVY